MSPLKREFRSLRAHGNPSREFEGALRAKLSEAYQAECGGQKRLGAPMHRFALAGALAVVLLVTTGTGVYAYESPEVVESHALYPIKSGIESLEERLARSPEARAKFRRRMFARRIEEADRYLELRGRHERRFRAVFEQLEAERQRQGFLEEFPDNPRVMRELQRVREMRGRYQDLQTRLGQ